MLKASYDIWSGKDGEITKAQIQSTIECGKHSGIPECCVLHYIGTYRWLTVKAQGMYRNRARATGLRWNYVPCKKCLRTQKMVKIRPCSDKCPQMRAIAAKKATENLFNVEA